MHHLLADSNITINTLDVISVVLPSIIIFACDAYLPCIGIARNVSEASHRIVVQGSFSPHDH